MKEVALIFPNQLHEESQILDKNIPIYLIEENLFFKQYSFHKQKIFFHRTSMKKYVNYLTTKLHKVNYIESSSKLADVRELIKNLSPDTKEIYIIDPNDYLLEKRIKKSCNENNISLHVFDNSSFINTREDLTGFFREEKVKFFQTSFYKEERKKYNILMDGDSPEGGRWTYDDENRKKYPRDKIPPEVRFPDRDNFHEDAKTYTEKFFKNNIGSINTNWLYPTSFSEAKEWLSSFLIMRFQDFGPYEDAIVKEETILNHSILSPLINCGLLTPKYVINEIIKFHKGNDIPINSTEGFIRQVIGWREFIRGIYVVKGSYERTRNFWGFERKIPRSFYDGTTGIEPVDDTIRKVISTGYCHHIERLMVMGNFMLLCEFDPDEVYRWFMELFIDSYDWVMVPNVYGMSQFADGGLMSTKPYISGSSYILKMSNYKKGEWCIIWDSLFWRFLNKQRDFFIKNPRMRMLINTYDKMDQTKKENYQITAEEFISKI